MHPKNRAYGLKNWLAACFGVVEGSPPFIDKQIACGVGRSFWFDLAVAGLTEGEGSREAGRGLRPLMGGRSRAAKQAGRGATAPATWGNCLPPLGANKWMLGDAGWEAP